MLKQSKRSFVEKLHFVTTVGYGEGKDHLKKLGIPGKGPIAIITDLGIMEPDPDTKEFILTQIYPGVSIEEVKEANGWELKIIPDLQITRSPSREELNELRALKEMQNKPR